MFALLGCKNTNDKSIIRKELPNEVFPVIPFFEQQIQQVDSLQFPTTQYFTFNEKTDTVAISMVQFRNLANEFMVSDITKAPLKNYYKENSFADQSVPSVTITYNTENKDLPIQRLDIIIKPNPVLADKVQTIFIEKKFINNDTLIFKKLYWKADANFQIITSKQIGSNPESVTKLKVAWNYTD
jgi:hypothetical protein